MTRTWYAPAKINLWLRVFAPDDTGYHPLDTLFCAIGLQDELEIGAGKGIALSVTGADVGPIESNLAFRAAQEYFLAIGEQPSIAIHLHKNIPAGAGLGGGSSDAATVLLALQERFQNTLPDADLLALAARLGSDVPFFLCGSAWARARGRGEVLEQVAPLPPRPVLVLIPDFPVPTRDAYRWLDESGTLIQPDAQWPAPRSWHDVDARAVNAFEAVLFAKYPVLAELRDQLLRSDAAIALVSGSGSAVVGIFADDVAAERAQQNFLAQPHLRTFLTRTLA
ncbi:MAG TPA: 4-(cytidine 5'-diphospho)-2-C-methyl-D-erythritol kinase [Longimicrobiales bacterium]